LWNEIVSELGKFKKFMKLVMLELNSSSYFLKEEGELNE
jgi:hypothetical protein